MKIKNANVHYWTIPLQTQPRQLHCFICQQLNCLICRLAVCSRHTSAGGRGSWGPSKVQQTTGKDKTGTCAVEAQHAITISALLVLTYHKSILFLVFLMFVGRLRAVAPYDTPTGTHVYNRLPEAALYKSSVLLLWVTKQATAITQQKHPYL